MEVEERGVVELNAKAFGHERDEIRIRESAILPGEDSRGLVKTRVVLEHDAVAEVTGVTEAYAKNARGHVDCREVVKDRAKRDLAMSGSRGGPGDLSPGASRKANHALTDGGYDGGTETSG